MKIDSNDIPQADVLTDVIKTVLAVADGAKSFQDIAKYIGKVERQGRYYRRAAEIVGFIENAGNSARLTALGKEFIKTGANLKNPILISAVLNIRIFQRLIAFLETKHNGANRAELTHYLGNVTEDIGASMLPRRVSTLTAWLEALDIIEERDHRVLLTSTINREIPILEFQDIDEPILPRSGELSEYETVEQRAKSAKDSILIYKDQTKLDRANQAHTKLVNLVANKLRAKGNLPKSNQLIDLATRVDDTDYIFEMKSITSANAKSQVSKGVSQLYEYRYLQATPTAKLILVTEIALPTEAQWMCDYLESDRNILLLWDGDDRLHASSQTREKLNFLW